MWQFIELFGTDHVLGSVTDRGSNSNDVC